MATKPAPDKTSAKTKEAASERSEANKPRDNQGSHASPFDEMGAEDESPHDAGRSKDKAGTSGKKPA